MVGRTFSRIMGLRRSNEYFGNDFRVPSLLRLGNFSGLHDRLIECVDSLNARRPEGEAMTHDPLCRRCGKRAQHINSETNTSFWGFVKSETETTTIRTVRVLATTYRYKPHEMTSTNEAWPLCGDCWCEFVVEFGGQQRSVLNTIKEKP